MIHHGSYGFSGLTQEAFTDLVELLKESEMMLRIYVARLKSQGRFKKWGNPKIHEMLKRQFESRIDVWLTSDEARQWGFVDEVFDGNWEKLRTTKINRARRDDLNSVIRKKIHVDIKVS